VTEASKPSIRDAPASPDEAWRSARRWSASSVEALLLLTPPLGAASGWGAPAPGSGTELSGGN
jgi:hypothetical protein